MLTLFFEIDFSDTMVIGNISNYEINGFDLDRCENGKGINFSCAQIFGSYSLSTECQF